MNSCCHNLLHVVPSDPVDVQFYGDVVVWNEPLNPNGQITEYEIQFLIPGTQLRINRSRNSRGTFYAVREEDKLGGIQDTYFRVRIKINVLSSYSHLSFVLYKAFCAV